MTSRGDQVTAVALGLLFSVSFVEIPLASLGALSFTSTELCIACWLVAAAWVTRARGWRPDQIGWGLLAVMASMLLTTAVVPADRGAALKFVIRFGVGVLVYLSLRAALHGPRLLTALRALTVAGLCFSALGAVQHYFPGVLDPVLSLIVPNKFAAYDPAAPLSFTTGVFFDGREFVVRASAVFGYCNTFSYFLVVALGGGLLLLLHDRDRYWRETAALSLPVNLWALWLTYSRGAWLALLVGVATGAAGWGLASWRQHRWRLWVVAAVLVCCAVPVVLGAFRRPQPPPRPDARVWGAEALRESVTPADTMTTRLQLWRAAGRMWLTAPLFGAGVDRFRHEYHCFLPSGDYDLFVGQGLYQPHNLALTALAWQGVVGLAALAFCLYAIGRTWWRRRGALTDARFAVVTGLLASVGAANLYDAMMYDSYPHLLTVNLVLALLVSEEWCD